MDIKGLRDGGLLVVSDDAVAVVGDRGWTSLPEPLASQVRDVLAQDDD